MSLLLDALRKAEKEKKEAEARRRATVDELQEQEADSEKGTTESPPERASDTDEIPITGNPDRRAGQPDQPDTSALSLAPIEEPVRHGGRGAADETGELSTRHAESDEFDRFELDHPATMSLDEHDDGEDLFDETFHNAEIDLESLPELYEETVQGEEYDVNEPAFDETLPGVPAVEMVKDIGDEHQPTPVAAQTVFSAGATTRKSGFPWMLLTAALVVVVAAIGVIVYNAVTPIARDIPSPAVSSGIENTVLPELAAAGLDLETVTGNLNEPPPGALTADEDAIIREASARQATAGTEASLEITEPPVSTVTEEAPETHSGAGESAAVSEPVASERLDKNTGPAASLPESIEVEPSMIRISRSRVPDDRSRMISTAYDSYQQGDLTAASAAYNEVLENYPDNRDALLGLGAIALQEGKIARARNYYARLLQLNPMDELARAILINLARNENPVSRESAVKILLHEKPEDPYLHFTLGNIYAAQQRWPEAQQSFFDAYRNDPENPDYANNLAVSLDRMGQHRAALDYYQSALELAESRDARFNRAEVVKRIQTITTR